MYDLAITKTVVTGIVAAAAPPITVKRRCNPPAGEHRRTALLALLATFGFLDHANAQQPKPPLLLAGGQAPSSSIIFKETFSGFNIGTYHGVAGVWNTGSSVPNGQCSFQQSNPLVSGGGKYLRCGPVVKDGANVFRTEFKYVGSPSFDVPTDLGGGHSVSEIFWYGSKFCLDKYTTGDGPHGRVHFFQWHDVDDGPFSPKVSLLGNAQQLQVYIEHNEEQPPINTGGFKGGSIISPVLYTTHYQKCIDVIWQIRWDTRTSDQGSQGLVRLWLGDNSTPVFEWVNRATQHALPPTGFGDLGVPYFPMGGYLSCWRESQCVPEGTVYEARFDNFTVMDKTGSWAAMTAELNRPD